MSRTAAAASLRSGAPPRPQAASLTPPRAGLGSARQTREGGPLISTSAPARSPRAAETPLAQLADRTPGLVRGNGKLDPQTTAVGPRVARATADAPHGGPGPERLRRHRGRAASEDSVVCAAVGVRVSASAPARRRRLPPRTTAARAASGSPARASLGSSGGADARAQANAPVPPSRSATHPPPQAAKASARTATARGVPRVCGERRDERPRPAARAPSRHLHRCLSLGTGRRQAYGESSTLREAWLAVAKARNVRSTPWRSCAPGPTSRYGGQKLITNASIRATYSHLHVRCVPKLTRRHRTA